MFEANTVYAWWVGLFLAALGTYFWRSLGVLLSGHISQDGEIFRWLSAVTYAMVAALTFRLILMPAGILGQIPLYYRIIAAFIGLAVMMSGKGRLIPALLTGSGLMILYGLFK